MSVIDDDDEIFMPLSITGIPTKVDAGKSEISFSQSSSFSRLSKSKKKNILSLKRKPTVSQSYAESTSSVTGTSEAKLSPQTVKSPGLQFCPTCQAPFEIINISPDVHAVHCKVAWSELEECPDGELCFNRDIYHYRDYAHRELAVIRSSKGHISCSSLSDNRFTAFKSPKPVLKARSPQSKDLLNIKKKLFNDSVSVISLSSDSSTKENNISLKHNGDLKHSKGSPSITQESRPNKHIRIPERTPSKCENGKQYLDDDDDDIFGKCELDDQVSNTDDDDEYNIFKVPKRIGRSNCQTEGDVSNSSKKRKAENSVSQMPNKKIKKQDHIKLPHDDTNPSRLSTKLSRYPKTQEQISTILDAIDSLSESGGERNDSLNSSCSCDHKTITNVDGCRNCKKKSEKFCKEMKQEQSTSRSTKEVRATMSVVVSPTSENENVQETPVKIDASCSVMGWETVGIAVPPATEVDDVKVSVCKCAKTMEVNCSLLQKNTVIDIANDTEVNKLEVKFFSKVSETPSLQKISRNSESFVPGNHQMSITSFFKALKQPSTLSFKTSIESDTEEEKSHDAQEENSKAEGDLTTSKDSIAKKKGESAVPSWKDIIKRYKQKGLSTLSVASSDSLATLESHSSSESYQKTYYSSKKTCPFYKKIPDTTFAVDAFQYGLIPGISHYFLSHFHYDHYGGLKKSFSKPIFCSKITAALVKMKLRVDEKYIRILELDCPRQVRDVLVTALDANHCPGSLMFLFQLQDGRNFLHVGDFRADPKMESYPCFWNLAIDKLFLDTTYCEPQYSFPMQSETITRVVEIAMEHHSKTPTTLFVCGTYTIGKEKVFIAIADALDCKLWAHPEKMKVLDCIDDPAIKARLTTNQLSAQVHVCRMYDLGFQFLQRYLKQHSGKFTHLVAFKPTGWELRRGRSKIPEDDINVTSYGNITIYGVPYSEHSSFTELRRFVQFLKPQEVIPTVNVGVPAKRNAMQRHFRQWLTEPPSSSQRTHNETRSVQQNLSRYLCNKSQDS